MDANKALTEKIRLWLRKPANFYLLAILIFAFILRLYYFLLTQDQALWWDEAEYMAYAKKIVFGTPYDISPKRVVLFPFLISLIFRVGLSEQSVRFFLVLVPSVLVVFFTYLLAKEMYSEKIALLTAFLTAVLWIHLFYSARVMNDEMSFLFGLLAFYFFWKGYAFGKNNKFVYISGFFIALSFLLRPAGIYYGVIIAIFVLITENFKFLKKPALWGMVLVFLLTLSPHLIWSYYHHGDALAFTGAYGGPGEENFGWDAFKFIPLYTEKVFLAFFFMGLITFITIILGFDQILKGSKKYQNDLFIAISMIFLLGINIFVLRSFEERWFMAMSFAIFIITSKGIMLTFQLIKKYIKELGAITIIILIIFSGAYIQLKHADQIIKLKVNTYAEIRAAGLWIKDNSNPQDSVWSRSLPQLAYYSERRVFRENSSVLDVAEQELLNQLNEEKPKYFVLYVFENHAPWMFEFPAKYPEVFVPVQVYTLNNQPILVIYKISYNNLQETA